jgi:hypothetical protein
VFLPVRRYVGTQKIVYVPHLLALCRVHFVDTRRGLSASEEVAQLTPLDDSPLGIAWSNSEDVGVREEELAREPVASASFATPPAAAAQVASYAAWKKSLTDHLHRTRRYQLFKSNALGEFSRPGESERDFRIRLTERAREVRDEAIDNLRRKYAAKLVAAEERVHRAGECVESERQQAEGAGMQTAVSWGATILSAVLGRKRLGPRTLGRAASAARDLGRSRKQAGDVQRAEEKLDRYEQRLHDLEQEIQQEEELIKDRFDPLQEALDTIQLRPRRTDVDVRLLALAWTPLVAHADGTCERLFQ